MYVCIYLHLFYTYSYSRLSSMLFTARFIILHSRFARHGVAFVTRARGPRPGVFFAIPPKKIYMYRGIGENALIIKARPTARARPRACARYGLLLIYSINLTINNRRIGALAWHPGPGATAYRIPQMRRNAFKMY